MEFYNYLFDLLGQYFLRVVEDIYLTRKVLGIMNASFLVHFLKIDCPTSSDDFYLI